VLMMTDHMQVIYVSRVPCLGEVIFLSSADVEGGQEWTVTAVHHINSETPKCQGGNVTSAATRCSRDQSDTGAVRRKAALL